MHLRQLAIVALAVLPVGAGIWFVPSAAAGGAAAKSCCSEAESAAKAEVAAKHAAADERRAQVRIPDKVLLDQDGEKVRLYSDLIAGKKVIISFIFTTCTSVCPTLQSVFEGVQKQLGDRLGDEVRLISITVDPGTDTPERLKSFAGDYNAGPGWTFLTGKTEDINEVLHAFGVYTRTKEEHSSMFVLGHEVAGRWMYMSGFVAPETVVRQLDALCNPK